MKRFILSIIIVTMLVACSPRFKPGADFSRETIRDQSISNTDLQNIDFGGSNLINVDLSYSNLSNAIFKGIGTHIESSNLSNAVLKNADFGGSHIKKSNFHNADLSGANLRLASLEFVDFSGANLSDADLSDAFLWGVDLSDANLSGADLSKTELRGCILRGVDLRDADLSETIIEGCDLTLDTVIRANNFEDEKMISALFGNVCRGEGASNAAAYNSEAISPVIMLSLDKDWIGYDYDSPYIAQALDYSSQLPQSWVSSDLQLIELVSCVRPIEYKLIETCDYIDGPDINRYQPTYNVSIVQTLTGEILASKTFLGTLPRECKSTESRSKSRLYGGIPYDSIIDWMTQFVEP